MRLLLLLAVLLAACAAVWLLGGTAGDDGAGSAEDRARLEEAGAGEALEVADSAAGTGGPHLTGAPSGARGRGPGAGPAAPANAAATAAQLPTPPPPPAPTPVRVAGIVHDAQGQPVSDAEVSAPSVPGKELRTLTDAEGRFVLELPPPGAFALVARKDGGAQGTPASGTSGGALRITLTDAPSIVGRVVDAATGRPIRGVVVEARAAQAPTASETLAQAATAEDGTFTLPVPRAGAYEVQVATGSDFATPEAPDGYVLERRAVVETGGPALEIALTLAQAIEGVLLDDAGERLRVSAWLVAVGMTAEGQDDYTRRRGVRAEGGVLRIAGLAPGRYRITAQPKADRSGASDVLPYAVAVVEGVEAGTRGLEVRLPRGIVLRGRLVDGAGAAVLEARGMIFAAPEGQIRLRDVTVGRLLGDGTFEIGPLASDRRIDLHLQQIPGYRPMIERRVDPRTDGLTLHLTQGGRISGRVVLDAGRPGPAGVPVGLLAIGIEPLTEGWRQFVHTAQDGSFTADGLLDAPYEVEAGGGTSGYLGTTAHAVKPGTTNVVLRVVEGLDLVGTLIDARGEPMSAQSLQADDGMHIIAMRPYVQVGPDGRFRLRGLAPGKVRLGFQRGDRWVPLGEFTAPATDLRVLVPAP